MKKDIVVRFDRELLKLIRIEAIKNDLSLKEMFDVMWKKYSVKSYIDNVDEVKELPYLDHMVK